MYIMMIIKIMIFFLLLWKYDDKNNAKMLFTQH